MALSQGSGVRLEPQLAQPRLVVTLAEVGPAHHFGLPFHDQRKAFYTSRLARLRGKGKWYLDESVASLKTRRAQSVWGAPGCISESGANNTWQHLRREMGVSGVVGSESEIVVVKGIGLCIWGPEFKPECGTWTCGSANRSWTHFYPPVQWSQGRINPVMCEGPPAGAPGWPVNLHDRGGNDDHDWWDVLFTYLMNDSHDPRYNIHIWI